MTSEDTSTSGGSSTGTDPTGTPSTGTTGDPGSTSDPSTTGTAETGDPGSTTEPTAGTTTSEEGSSTGDEGGASTWRVEVDVDLGGVFPVTATAVVGVDGDVFTADVVTETIGGQPEVHEIPLSGTIDGTTATLVDSPFSITVGGVTEDILVSGTATVEGDTLTGSGTMTVSIDGGEPIPGSYTVTDATLVE